MPSRQEYFRKEPIKNTKRATAVLFLCLFEYFFMTLFYKSNPARVADM